MIIVMKPQAAAADVAAVVELIRSKGLREHVSEGAERTIIGAVGDERVFDPEALMRLPQVERAIRVVHDWRIVSRDTRPQDSIITVRGVAFGGSRLLHIGHSPDPRYDAVYCDPFYLNPRPYAEHGSGSEKAQLRLLRDTLAAAHCQGKPVLVRIRDARQLQTALQEEADILFLGGGLMNNRSLLDEIGRLNTPVVLCKDRHHRIGEWLLAAEHIALRGNHQIILGEAGTLSLDPDHPARLDIESIVRARRLSHLPVLADISRLWHNDMPADVLTRLAAAAGAHAVIGG